METNQIEVLGMINRIIKIKTKWSKTKKKCLLIMEAAKIPDVNK